MARPKQKWWTKIPRYGTNRDVAGLPEDGRVVTVTNSERGDTACDLRWWFRHGELIESAPTRPMDLGTAFHAAMEDIYRWWMEHDAPYPMSGPWECAWCIDKPSEANAPETDCPHCGNTWKGPVARYADEWRKLAAERASGTIQPGVFGPESVEEADKMAETLSRCVDGYLRWWGQGPPDYRVIAVEKMIGRPIVHPTTGLPLMTPVTLVGTPGSGYYFATRMDSEAGCKTKTFRWPWYVVGKADAIGQDRSSGRLILIEHKSTAQVEHLIAGLTDDPQTITYQWILEHVATTIPGVPADRPVMGGIFDVASSSMQRDPKVLKAGGLSVDAGALTPSWRYLDAIAREGLDPAVYADHVRYLREFMDPRFYRREPIWYGVETISRVADEWYAHAQRIASMRRKAMESFDAVEVARAFPRTPICRLPGGACTFRGICTPGPFTDGHMKAPRKIGQRWFMGTPVNVIETPTSARPAIANTVTDDDLGF